MHLIRSRRFLTKIRKSGVKMRLKGSVTVFVSMILSVIIAFAGIMVDLSRLQTGKKHAQSAVQLSLQSALTRYHAPLKEQYGIMATGQDSEELETLIFELLEKNLTVENRYIPEVIDLYGFEIDNLKVMPFFNMTENYVLEQQIVQFMKYRAPVNTIGNFIEKLKSLNTFMSQSGLLNKKMDLEKKLQKIREEQVYLSLLLSQRISSFITEQSQNGNIKKRIDSIEKQLQCINTKETCGAEYDTAFKSMPDLADNIVEVKDKIENIKRSTLTANDELKSFKSSYEDIEKSIKNNNSYLEKSNKRESDLEKSISDENKKKQPDIQKILSMQKEIEILKNEINTHNALDDGYKAAIKKESEKISAIEKEISRKNREIEEHENSISKEMELLRDKVGICLSVLKDIKETAEIVYSSIFEIEGIINKYIRYHQQSLSLAEQIEKGAKTAEGLIEDINAELAKQIEKSDNSFLMRIRADIEKLVLNTDLIVLSDIRYGINVNLTELQNVQNSIQNSIKIINEQLNGIDLLSKTIEAITVNCDIPQKQEFGGYIGDSIKLTENHINAINGIYKEPEYSIEPKINKKEENEFYKWCNKIFNEENKTDSSTDKGYQKKLKQNIGNSDKENKDTQVTYNGEDEALSDQEINNIFSCLPSFKDKDGNYINVKKSDFSVKEIRDDHNLLEEPISGELDLEEKYGGLLNRNSSFSEKLGQAISGSSEALIESMYVNEFIVGAFKNANIDTTLPPKIRPASFSDETFYEKAEVEYIIFGGKRERTNVNFARTAIFGVRMGLNIIHVYTNTDKTAAAFAAATVIAGWTGFGVPLVKNLILIGWAAGESWLDIKDLNAGKPVPIYKTKNTWKLNLKSLFSDVAEQFLDESSDWFKQKKDEMIDKGDDALQTVVKDMVSSAIHEAFVSIEQAIEELGEGTDKSADTVLQGVESIGVLKDLEDLRKWVIETVGKQYDSIKEEGTTWTKLKLEDYKKKITEKISGFIFESNSYKKLVSQIKDGLDSIIDKGATQLADSIRKLGTGIKDTTITDQIVGMSVSFDYIDYLRLLLLIVPQQTKLLRTADLMQLNLQKSLANPDFCLSDYNSFIIIEADISMKYLFLPLFSHKNDKGQIKIRWGYGY